MKSENKTNVRCKQPMKVKRPLLCPCHFLAKLRSYIFRIFFVIIFSFCFINALQSDDNNNNYCNWVYVLGHNIMLWDIVKNSLIFNLCLAAQVKMSLSQAQKVIIVYVYDRDSYWFIQKHEKLIYVLVLFLPVEVLLIYPKELLLSWKLQDNKRKNTKTFLSVCSNNLSSKLTQSKSFESQFAIIIDKQMKQT